MQKKIKDFILFIDFFLLGFILGNRCQDACNTLKVIRFQTSTALPAWCAPCPWPMIQSLWAPGSDSQCTTRSIATKLAIVIELKMYVWCNSKYATKNKAIY